jgi:hypothetical protein
MNELALGMGEILSRLPNVPSGPEDEIRRKGHFATLGIAFLYHVPDRMERLRRKKIRKGNFRPITLLQFERELRRAYASLTANPPSEAGRIRKRAYDKFRYKQRRRKGTPKVRIAPATRDSMKEQQELARQEAAWSDQLSKTLTHEYERLSSPPQVPHDEAIEQQTIISILQAFTPFLPPAERRGLESLLAGGPAIDDADRQRRHRAERSIRKLLLLHLKGRKMDKTLAAQVSENTSDIREIRDELQELREYVGLLSERDIEVVVDNFLASLGGQN